MFRLAGWAALWSVRWSNFSTELSLTGGHWSIGVFDIKLTTGQSRIVYFIRLSHNSLSLIFQSTQKFTLFLKNCQWPVFFSFRNNVYIGSPTVVTERSLVEGLLEQWLVEQTGHDIIWTIIAQCMLFVWPPFLCWPDMNNIKATQFYDFLGRERRPKWETEKGRKKWESLWPQWAVARQRVICLKFAN